MSDVTQVAFQIDNHNLAELDAAVHRGEFRSRADALRTATLELLAARREARIDAQLEAGYAQHPQGEDEAAWAEISLEGSGRPTLTGDHPRRAEIWLADMDKVRPVVVMHRDFAGRRLNAVLAVPLTSTLRDLPTAVRLGPEDGLDRECVAPLDNLTLVPRSRFIRRTGTLAPGRMEELCRALAIAVACS